MIGLFQGALVGFAHRLRVQTLVLRAMLRDDAVTKEAILASPAALAFEDDPDWELIEYGGDWDEYKDSADPSQCECGNWWTAKVAEAVFAQKPNQNDIAALMKKVPEPTDAQRPKCSGESVSQSGHGAAKPGASSRTKRPASSGWPVPRRLCGTASFCAHELPQKQTGPTKRSRC